MSTQPQLPPIASLPTLPPDSLTTVLTTLFEPSPHLPPLILPIISSSPTPDSYTSLITSIRTRLHTLAASSTASDREVLDSVLSSHPRLGAPKDADISALSRGEQANLNSGEVGEELGRLNGEYEGRFGVRYVVFVNGRGRDVIMEDMRRRIERGDGEAERREGVDAMCDIALDRARKLSGEKA